MMTDLLNSVSALVDEEYKRAASEHGGAANTPHEGYALIKEEEEEAADQMTAVSQRVTSLWLEVKSDNLKAQHTALLGIRAAAILGACELIQVAAMADKTIIGLNKLAGSQ